jgi:S1-C subfamily serine protease
VRPATVQVSSRQVQLDQFNRAFEVPAGVGTGIIYKREGFILTNNHVIENAQTITVSLADGRSFQAQLVGRDARTDLAVLKIEGSNLPVGELGNSDELEVGDWAVAIGHALGLPGGPTITAGIVSALNRTAQEPDASGGPGPTLFNLIQTDAAINPGNSGGPLSDMAGRVIGINTLVAGAAGEGIQAQGIGFAIAINTAKRIAEDIEADGRVDHAWLGVSYVPLSPAIASQLGVKADQNGAVVTSVEPGSPAASAGLSRGDIITEVDGDAIEGESDLSRLIDEHKPGERVSLTLLRQGAETEVQVTLGRAPD